MSREVLALGADPGKHGGLALARCRVGVLPELLGCWSFSADRMGPYLDRALGAALGAQALRAGKPVAVWIEEVPPFGRAQVAAGLARRQGLILAALHIAGFPEPDRVLPLSWAKHWRGQIRSGKDKETEGAHRIDEVGKLFQPGALELLRACGPVGRDDRVVDVAEAILMAGAAGIAAFAAEAQVSLELKTKPVRKRRAA